MNDVFANVAGAVVGLLLVIVLLQMLQREKNSAMVNIVIKKP